VYVVNRGARVRIADKPYVGTARRCQLDAIDDEVAQCAAVERPDQASLVDFVARAGVVEVVDTVYPLQLVVLVVAAAVQTPPEYPCAAGVGRYIASELPFDGQ
jgi:hypothetical protein